MSDAVLVGIDLVQIREIAASIARFGEHFVRRVFTDGEIEYCRAAAGKEDERFAARFAAKEAAMKVLRPGDVGLDLRHIEVRRMAGGWSELVLHGAAETLARQAGLRSFSVSMSHEGEYATAVVVAMRAGEGG